MNLKQLLDIREVQNELAQKVFSSKNEMRQVIGRVVGTRRNNRIEVDGFEFTVRTSPDRETLLLEVVAYGTEVALLYTLTGVPMSDEYGAYPDARNWQLVDEETFYARANSMGNGITPGIIYRCYRGDNHILVQNDENELVGIGGTSMQRVYPPKISMGEERYIRYGGKVTVQYCDGMDDPHYILDSMDGPVHWKDLYKKII